MPRRQRIGQTIAQMNSQASTRPQEGSLKRAKIQTCRDTAYIGSALLNIRSVNLATVI